MTLELAGKQWHGQPVMAKLRRRSRYFLNHRPEASWVQRPLPERALSVVTTGFRQMRRSLWAGACSAHLDALEERRSMIPPEALNRFQEIISIEMFEMERAYGEALARKQAELSAKGALNSSGAVFIFAAEARHAVRAGGQVILSQLLRCLTAYGTALDAENVAEAKDRLRQQLDLHATVLRSRLLGLCHPMRSGLGSLADQVGLEFNQELKRVADRMATELDIVAAASKAKAATLGSTFTFNAPVGVVQTGDASVATVHQHIGSDVKVQVTETLKRLLTDLDAPENSHVPNRAALKELVRETADEAEKPVPNALKLSGGLRTIAETVKFVGTMEATYDALKPILGALGIHLP